MFRVTLKFSPLGDFFFSEKEKKEQMLKDVEMKKAQCEIIKLKGDLMSEQTSRKRSRVEFEKDIEMVQSEKEVCKDLSCAPL